jgi:transcriptional regulator with PAS, ATPase and Fis domain
MNKGLYQRPCGGGAGKFAQANRGTQFLGEIGDMAMEVQAKLLRVVQLCSVTRLGSARATLLAIAIISASHRDL